MVKTVIIPQESFYSLPIPAHYIGKSVEVLFYSIDEIEPFDYTEWQRDLFNDMSVRELSSMAMKKLSISNANSLVVTE